jgi:hypothetical protein
MGGVLFFGRGLEGVYFVGLVCDVMKEGRREREVVLYGAGVGVFMQRLRLLRFRYSRNLNE